jgi:hypothetical protein
MALPISSLERVQNGAADGLGTGNIRMAHRGVMTDFVGNQGDKSVRG